MKKRLISLLACGVLTASAVAGLTGCSDNSLTVWGSAAQQETLKQMVEEYKKANPDLKYDIKVGICEEDMAVSNIAPDPSAAADVFCYSNDQLIPLLRVGALAKVGGQFLNDVKTNNSAESVSSGAIAYGTADEAVYGYPYASDNGYFMFYNKSVLTEEEVGSLETIISVCESKNKQIAWALDVPWYTAGWFFAYGCDYSVEYDYNDNYNEKNIDISLNNEGGINACKAMAKLTASSAFAGKGTDNEKIITGFSTGSTAVAVSGTWNAAQIKNILGKDYGVCKLPTVNVNGTDVQLSSFKGYKLFGVNPHSGDKLVEAHMLAAFLSSEAMQSERFEKHMVGPTNIAAANAIKNDATFLALNEQNKFAKEQTSVPSSFWEPLKGVGLNIIDGLITEAGGDGKLSYEAKLSAVEKQIKNSK
ncbi:MAG: extracellular solute-binding protein [Clostridia bacterium]|nr:extracellular solute-binding protein [Clostridia bacterium]